MISLKLTTFSMKRRFRTQKQLLKPRWKSCKNALMKKINENLKLNAKQMRSEKPPMLELRNLNVNRNNMSSIDLPNKDTENRKMKNKSV